MIWQNGFICQRDLDQVRVTLGDDGRSILVHARGADTQASLRNLMSKFLRAFDDAMLFSEGISFEVHLLNTTDLIVRNPEPCRIPLYGVIIARSKGVADVDVSSDCLPHQPVYVPDLLALDEICKSRN